MRFATPLVLLSILGTASIGRADGTPAPTPTPTTDPAAAPSTPAIDPNDVVRYGIDVRLREVFLPKALMNLFVERAAGGAQSFGYGIDLVRRRGTLELQLGAEFEHIALQEGVYINKGDDVGAGDTADYILSPDHAGSQFGWVTVEFSFINHAVINKYLAFRYGGGLGLGVLTGQVRRVDTACGPGATNDNPTPGCIPTDYGGTGHSSDDKTGAPESPNGVAYDLPGVFPVVNAILGLQIRPTDHIVVNIEGGIRTLPFVGTSVGYFF